MSIVVESTDFCIPRLPVRRFSVEEYHQIAKAGILDEDDNVELLEGWIVLKMSRNPPHDTVFSVMDKALRAVLPSDWEVRTQSALTTSTSEPEPDIAVIRGPLERYFSRHPMPHDVGLVIEIADTSLERDRHDKGPIYASAGIGCYWIVNVPEQIIEVYSEPVGREYRVRTDYTKEQQIPLLLDGAQAATLSVAQLLGRR